MFTLTFTFNNRRVAYLWIRYFLFAFNYELFLCQILGPSNAHIYIHTHHINKNVHIWRHICDSTRRTRTSGESTKRSPCQRLHWTCHTPGRSTLILFGWYNCWHLINSNGLRSLARNQWIDILRPFFFNISYFLLISLFVVNWFAFVKASIDAHAHMYNT